MGANKSVDKVSAVFDVEITSRCNAKCLMCPRDKVPELGSMDEGTFRRLVERVVEYGKVDALVLGGLGEPTVHKDVVKFVGIAADAGLHTSIITNGMLMDRDMSKALVDAGVRNIDLSIGGFTKEAYEQVQIGCKFEKVYQNGLDFIDVAKGKAFLNIQISPTEITYPEAEDIAKFWQSHGARFCFIFPFMASRGGALEDGNVASGEHADERRVSKIPKGCINIEELFRPSSHDYKLMHKNGSYVCYPKDRFCFVSWRGTYHICSNDFEKLYPLGDVFDTSVADAFAQKSKICPENNAMCDECRLSRGDLPARNLKVLFMAGSYMMGAAMSRLSGKTPHPELPQ